MKAEVLEQEAPSLGVWGADGVGQFADRRSGEERTDQNSITDEWVGLFNGWR